MVADSLNKILTRAQSAGLIQDLGNFPTAQQTLNLHFANDTLLFLQANSLYAENLKFLLLGFENLSGLTINFDKSSLVPLNISDTEALYFANQLGCKLEHLPITYLGVPLHWKKLSCSDWDPLVRKFENRLQSWKGSLLSLGGKAIL